MILQRLPAAADRAALRASCQALCAALDQTVGCIAVSLWSFGFAVSDIWGAVPEKLPALLARHPAAAVLVFRRTVSMYEQVLSMGENDMEETGFANSVGVSNKEVRARARDSCSSRV